MMANDFERKILEGKHIPIACGLYFRSDYPDIIESGYKFYLQSSNSVGCGIDVFDWFVGRIGYYSKLLTNIFNINIPLKEVTVAPLAAACYHCNEKLGNDYV